MVVSSVERSQKTRDRHKGTVNNDCEIHEKGRRPKDLVPKWLAAYFRVNCEDNLARPAAFCKLGASVQTFRTLS